MKVLTTDIRQNKRIVLSLYCLCWHGATKRTRRINVVLYIEYCAWTNHNLLTVYHLCNILHAWVWFHKCKKSNLGKVKFWLLCTNFKHITTLSSIRASGNYLNIKHRQFTGYGDLSVDIEVCCCCCRTIATWSLAGLVWLLFTMATFIPRARHNHQWYETLLHYLFQKQLLCV